ncbi:uncharacterized protein Z520_10797, partial [Fonsecaea multimorphosa CBS 102226]
MQTLGSTEELPGLVEEDDVRPSIENVESSGETTAEPGGGNAKSPPTKDFWLAHLEAAIAAVHQVHFAVRDGLLRREKIETHLNPLISHLLSLRKFYRQVRHDLNEYHAFLTFTREMFNTEWDYYNGLRMEAIKHLRWLEDISDPSSMLENIGRAECFGRLLEKRFLNIIAVRDNLFQANHELQVNVETLQKENLDKCEVITQLTAEHSDLKVDVEALHKKILDNREVITQLTAERSDLKVDVEALQKEILDNGEVITQLTAERGDLKVDVEALQKKILDN